MRLISLVTCACLLPVTATWADTASTGADIFKRACLNKLVLELDGGASLNEGIAAAAEANRQLGKLATKAQHAGVVGRPRYTFPEDGSAGRFFCHVSSKHLTAAEITPHFQSLARKASRAFGDAEYGKAAVDGDPGAQAEGLRATYRRDGLVVILEAIFYQSSRGPVGGYAISIDHAAD